MLPLQQPDHTLAQSPAQILLGIQQRASAMMQMTIRQKEAEQVAPYSSSFQRSMITSVLKADDGGVSQVLPPTASAH